MLDDGRHANIQQATTLLCCSDNIKNGVVLIVEDKHGSYLKEFGNPSKFSFINLTYHLVDLLNFRSETFKECIKSLSLPVS